MADYERMNTVEEMDPNMEMSIAVFNNFNFNKK